MKLLPATAEWLDALHAQFLGPAGRRTSTLSIQPASHVSFVRVLTGPVTRLQNEHERAGTALVAVK